MDHNELEKQEEDKKLKIKTDQETKKFTWRWANELA